MLQAINVSAIQKAGCTEMLYTWLRGKTPFPALFLAGGYARGGMRNPKMYLCVGGRSNK